MLEDRIAAAQPLDVGTQRAIMHTLWLVCAASTSAAVRPSARCRAVMRASGFGTWRRVAEVRDALRQPQEPGRGHRHRGGEWLRHEMLQGVQQRPKDPEQRLHAVAGSACSLQPSQRLH